MNEKSGQDILAQLIDEGSHTQLRDGLRRARECAINNAENYDELLFTLERLGCKLCGEIQDLYNYENQITKLANLSPLARENLDDSEKIHDVQDNESHTLFSRLYDIVRTCRNDALHQGAYARHLTEKAIQLSIILEDALMSKANDKPKYISDFMVMDPVCAELWQPISFIRQKMLANSFSYLPVLYDGKWRVISDFNIALYLRTSNNEDNYEEPSLNERKKRLAKPLQDVFKENKLILEYEIDSGQIEALVKQISLQVKLSGLQ